MKLTPVGHAQLLGEVFRKCVSSDLVRPLPTYADGIRLVVAVSGATALGKSTFCKRLTEFLAECGVESDHVALDGFLGDRSERERRRLSGYDPRSTDWVALLGALDRLIRRGQAIDVPVYDHTVGKRRDPTRVRPAEVLLLDGVTAMNARVEARFPNYRIFFDAEDDVIRALRRAVEVRERGYSAVEAQGHAEDELKAYHRFIRAHRERADLRLVVDPSWTTRVDGGPGSSLHAAS